MTLVYPFAKRFVSVPQAVLGVAFSFGIPMAFAAVRGSVPAVAWWLLAGNLFWVLAYDTEYAMVDRDDDLRIGMKTSAITFGRLDVAIVMASYAIFLAVWTVIGSTAVTGMTEAGLTAPATAASRPSGSITGSDSPCSPASPPAIYSPPNSLPSSAARRWAARMAVLNFALTSSFSIEVIAA